MKILRIALLMVSSLLFSGCWVFYGGGWLYSTNGGWINVGFEGTCTDVGENQALVDLELTWHDRGYDPEDVYEQNNNMKKHMVIMARNPNPIPIDTNCDEGDNDYTRVGGQEFIYCPPGVSPPSDDCGMAEIGVADTGRTGPDKGDLLGLQLVGGWYDGYQRAGPLVKGNITVESVID